MTERVVPQHAPHRVALPGTGGWSAWRTVLLRGTGFPAGRVLALGDPALAAAADAVLAASPDDADGAGTRYRDLYAGAEGRAAATIRAALDDETFREALVWQNRRFHDLMLPSFVAGRGRPYKLRQRRRTLARYLQRYCVKNDTIGFFGPVTWIELDPSGPSFLPPRPRELALRQVCFEGWTIDALARVLAEDQALRPWMVPRPLPFHYLDGDQLRQPLVAAALRKLGLPAGNAQALDAVDRALLAACDGERTAREVAARLSGAHPDASEREVFRRLARFVQQGVLAWDLEVPMASRPERALRRRLEKIGDDARRERALAALDELVSGRDAVARAAGDRRALSAALNGLEERFEQRIGRASTRADGRVYGARTLLYEDCRLDLPARLGRDVLERLGPPLGLVLTSARWLTWQVAAGFREVFDGLYDEICGELQERPADGALVDGAPASRAPRVDLASFAARVRPLLAAPRSEPLAAATAELQRRWAEILALPEGARRVERSSRELALRAAEAFAAPGPGWQLARYVSPDVMIAAAGRDAVERGEFHLVLGEVHLFNTLTRASAVDMHPRPEDLVAAREADIPVPTVAPVPSKEHNVQRMALALTSPRDVWLRYEKAPPGTPPERTLDVGELFVQRTEERLEVVSADGRWRFDVVEFFGYNLSNHCMSFPSLLAPAAHRPRLRVDGLVLGRESWTLPLHALELRKYKDSARAFRHLRALAAELGLPRFLFARLPGEAKPLYLDLASPTYVEILLSGLRRADDDARLHLSEMLPAFDQLWLTAAAGEAYCSELRLVSLDPLPPNDRRRERGRRRE